MQSRFRYANKTESLSATAGIGPTFGIFSIIKEPLANHEEIDRDDPFTNATKSGPALEEVISDNEEADEEVAYSGIPRPNIPPPSGPPKGYKYTLFEPKDDARILTGHLRISPTQTNALAALKDLEPLIRPKRQTGAGYQDPELDLWTRARLDGMQSLLRMYTNPDSRTYNHWSASSYQTAIGLGRGQHCARRLRELCRAFITNREVLPINPYGDWNESMLVDENLRNEIGIYLLSIGNEISAKKLMDFLRQPEIREKYGIEKNISHKTACRYLNSLGYRYKATPKGQYADGHERKDVVFYRDNVFLPQWSHFQNRMATWDERLVESAPAGPGRRVITWFHDESVFYAHDRRRKGWYLKDAPAKPYAKGEGASLMVADFVSADFGWLRSPDGKQSARRLFKPGKNRDGYFSNEDIQAQAQDAMDILTEYYPQFDHVFVYDNATTHLKRAEDALSARRMPKNIPKEGTNWGVEVTKRDSTTGKIIYRADGSPEKIKIRMRDTTLPDGTLQSLYFPEGHPRAGVFKGMAVILQERGLGDMSKVRAECSKFQCEAGATNCCCRRILYNQPDFVNAEPILQTVCNARGFRILLLPKFHCELNFIEQCWGRAKSIYRTYPESSREDRLEANTVSALESIPLSMMRKFANRSLRFMDAYKRGLNGRQAAWASRKYRGHRILPNDIMEELGKEGIA
jgi:hypothetical protein